MTRAISRQGDLLFIPISAAKSTKPNPLGGGVLALGEVTGHSHAIAPADLDGCDVYLDAAGRLIVRVKRGKKVAVRHQEHGPIELRTGSYEVRRQTEYTPAGWNRVAD